MAWTAPCTPHGEIRCAAVLDAAGAWSALLADQLSIERFRGQPDDAAELKAACRRAYARKYTKT